MKKLRVGVIYGGKSGEHEVSIASAASVFKYIDRSKYDPVPILIEKTGRWVLSGDAPTAISAADVHAQAHRAANAGTSSSSTAVVVAQQSGSRAIEPTEALSDTHIDVVFPVLHGPYGEDGTIQGLLELANVPYVGAGVLGSAAGMDKAVMKTLFRAHGLPVGPYIVVLRREWEANAAAITDRVVGELAYPVFVKPANLGSSVGISKAKSDDELREAMRVALEFDRKIVIEAAIPNAREIECAVLGNDQPEASIPGEIIPSREFYDYAAKYLDAEGSTCVIPAALNPDKVREIQRLSIDAFRAVEGSGLSRVDFLIARDTGATFVNEVNTMPGFTTISMYPKMWEASGLPYPDLLDRLVTLALERHAEKQRLRTSIT